MEPVSTKTQPYYSPSPSQKAHDKGFNSVKFLDEDLHRLQKIKSLFSDNAPISTELSQKLFFKVNKMKPGLREQAIKIIISKSVKRGDIDLALNLLEKTQDFSRFTGLIYKKNWEKALEAIERCSSNDFKKKIYSIIGIELTENNELEKALSIANKMIPLVESDPTAHTILDKPDFEGLYFTREQTALVDEIYEHLIKNETEEALKSADKFSRFKNSVLQLYTYALIKKGDYKSALQFIEKMTSLNKEILLSLFLGPDIDDPHFFLEKIKCTSNDAVKVMCLNQMLEKIDSNNILKVVKMINSFSHPILKESEFSHIFTYLFKNNKRNLAATVLFEMRDSQQQLYVFKTLFEKLEEVSEINSALKMVRFIRDSENKLYDLGEFSLKLALKGKLESAHIAANLIHQELYFSDYSESLSYQDTIKSLLKIIERNPNLKQIYSIFDCKHLDQIKESLGILVDIFKNNVVLLKNYIIYKEVCQMTQALQRDLNFPTLSSKSPILIMFKPLIEQLLQAGHSTMHGVFIPKVRLDKMS